MNPSLTGEGDSQRRREEVEARARLDVLAAVRPLAQLVDDVLLVEEAVPLREEVAQAVKPAPDVAADEAVSKSSMRIFLIIVSALR